jgi:hypothetical protein
MNEITISKAELALDLGNAGLNVLDYVPERIVPPIVIINVASPYLTPNTISREFVMSLELVAVAATATNKQATEKLDELIADVIVALPSYANLRNVLAPYNMQTNNAEYLAANIYVEIYITID